MSITWDSRDRPDPPPITAGGWILILLRAVGILVILGVGVVVSALTRIPEKLCHDARRPWTAPITRFALRLVLRVIGLRLRVEGRPMTAHGAVVANHASWLDILVLHSCQQVVFVSKSEVAGWPGIGFLARFVGTVFINRTPKDARVQRDVLVRAMDEGAKLMLFPEGTSTDGMRVLPFKSTLFEMMFSSRASEDLCVQPVTVTYHAPRGESDARIYGWWGDMDLGPHLLQVLARARQGTAQVTFHAPLAVRDHANRKVLAKAAEDAVRQGMPEDRRAAS